MIALQLLTEDDWQEWRALRLEALREAPYAFGSTLAEWQGLGDTEHRWRARLSSVPFNLVAYLDGTPAGIVSATEPEDGTTDLISMWVAPFARGRGVGDALVGSVITWARERGLARVVLDVTDGNHAAIALYMRHGFVDEGLLRAVDDSPHPERSMILELAPSAG